MVTGQTLLIDWEIRPSISVRMKISLVSWIVSTETDPKAGRESPPGTSPWFFAPADKGHFEPIKEASLKHLTFKTVSSWPWGRARVEVRYMLGKQLSTIDGYRSPIVDKLEIHPSRSVRTKISLVSWIVSSETDPEAGVAYLPGTSHWPCTS